MPSGDLRRYIALGKKIITTTVQKFLFVSTRCSDSRTEHAPLRDRD